MHYNQVLLVGSCYMFDKTGTKFVPFELKAWRFKEFQYNFRVRQIGFTND